jgi:tetratricopeptide (TPR) repeat protein
MIETKKAHELDVVELTEDLQEFGLRRGERGTVVEAFDDPEEAYMLEFVDESGVTSRLAYGVKPDQIKNIDTLAKEIYAQGMDHFQQGNLIEASRDFRRAVKLIPSYIRVLHESFRESLAESENWPVFIWAMQFIRLIDPSYEIAKQSLAIAYLNYGVQEAEKGNYEASLQLFQDGLRIETPPDITNLLKENIAASHTALGVQAHEKGDLELSKMHFESAYSFFTDNRTRRNLGMAYYHLATFYASQGDLRKTIRNYEWAENSGLVESEILNNHAGALANSGDVDDAILLLESAQALSPHDEVLQSNLTKLLRSKHITNFITESPNLKFSSVPPVKAVEVSAAA